MAVLLLIWLLSAPQGAPTASLDARAQAIVEQIFNDNVSPVVAQFNDRMKAALSEAQLRQAAGYVTLQAGAYQRQRWTRQQRGAGNAEGNTVVTIACEFEKGTVDVVIGFDREGRINGLSMRPPEVTIASALPPYATPARYRDSEVRVDAGGWPLGGTLSVPAGGGPFPAVVLVQGSGPSDRDETFGPNKPFRDLAAGLASRGTAVLRYEKRTKVHAQSVSAIRNFTINDETVDDAVAAVALLQRTPGIDPKRVFVVGHSQGAMMAPRIASRVPTLAGLVLLAAPARTLEESIVDQTRYLAMLDGKVDASEQAQIDTMIAMAAKIRALKPDDPPVVAPPFSAPASYFLDLRGYSAPEAARLLPQRLLILQGERDYQVTVADFAVWRKAMNSRGGVILKSYPALNHLFMPGSGPANPTEYMTPSHVSVEVVSDIADWIRQN